MKYIKYFLQFFFIILLLIFFKIIGLKLSRIFAGRFFLIFGPFFRSKKIIENNISLAFSKSNKEFKKSIVKDMWKRYQKILEKVKLSKDPVIFISGHFDNFELMAMHIERSGIDLAAIYRPLNNTFLNPIMENIRKKYICHKQIKKGISGTKEILKHFRSGTSIALMIDQRVSQGIKSPFFNKDALTTTIPAQFVKKFNCKIVPIYIERKKNDNFILEIMEPLNFSNNITIEDVTLKLNKFLEKMILRNPNQWIWSHNRWK